MNSKTYSLGPLFNNRPNQIVKDVPKTYHLHNIGPDQNFFQNQGELQYDPSRDPNVCYIKEPTGNRIVTSLEQQTDLECGKQISGYMADTRYQQFTDTSLKEEFMNQKMLFYQLENLIHHEMGDAHLNCDVTLPLSPSVAPISRAKPVMGMSSPGSDNSQSPHPRFDYIKAATPGHGTHRTYSINDPHSFRGPSCNDEMIASTSVVYNGKNILSYMGVKQVTNEVVPSPEPISSVTACSDVDWQSDKELIDSGTAFSSSGSQHVSEVSSENFIQWKDDNLGESNLIKHGTFLNNEYGYHADGRILLGGNMELPHPNACMSGQVFERISRDLNVFSSVIVNKPSSNHEDLLHFQLQKLGPQQFHHQPYIMQFDGMSEVEVQSQRCLVGSDGCYNNIPAHQSLKLCELPSVLGHGVQPQNPCTVQYASEGSGINFGLDEAPKLTDSRSLSLHDILLSYINYKNMPLNVGGSQVPFLNYLHLTTCTDYRCECDHYRLLISHFDNCDNSNCSVCGPVFGLYSASGRCNNNFSRALGDGDSLFTLSYFDGDILPPPKRMRVDNLLLSEDGPLTAVAPTVNQLYETDRYSHVKQWPEGPVGNKEVTVKMNKKRLSSSVDSRRAGVARNDATDNGQRLEYVNIPFLAEEVNSNCKLQDASASKMENDVTSDTKGLNCDSTLILSEKHPTGVEEEQMKLVPNFDNTKSEATGHLIEHSDDVQPQTGLQDPKKVGVPMVDVLTAEQIEEHIGSLNRRITKCNKDSTSNTVGHSLGESTCQLCAMDKLVFNPAPIYCSYCSARIKRNSIYYWTSDGMGGRHCFCTLCFRASRGGSISFQGLSFCKAKLVKERNNAENEESWVQCDKCERWQHQICALYNAKNDLEGKAKYICPCCRLQEIKVGEHVPLTAAFGAKDLPRTKLSHHIEQRLFRRLKEERLERAKSFGKNFDEVPGAADLVVRVVLSVNKQLKVKQQFLDIFHGENYPAEFPYRSKVILLFQKIEGVDVCLFGMYVQEFGSDCGPPNQRSIYISYLDSVKYFHPQIETVNGEALRTYVYHEILIGYLDYCKKRGFATGYIWACPPLKGEDYILSCHPETQKTPKSDKLRQWYKSMLRKSAIEDVVVNYTNLYDHFFVPNAQCSIKITAARLPYFDGDYWSGAAEDMIRKIGKESGGSEKRAKKLMTKRTLKAMGHTDLSAEAATDILVMQKLGQAILPVKEDFIIVHLQFTCTSCHEVIMSRSHWLCGQCKNFHLCPRCVDMEQNFNERTHTSISGEKHLLSEIVMNNIPDNTEDKDVILDNDIFENRHSFLSFCQENHYQFDTLRRAKHSSMMILYHLHKQTLTMVVTCSICQKDTMVDEGWLCEICPEFYVCNTCYQRDGGRSHIHKLIRHSSTAEWGTKNEQLQKQKAVLEKNLLEVLVHALQCRCTKDNPCTYSKCFQMRKLFHHASHCNLRAAGGCGYCKRVWFLLHLHSKNCTDSGCQVPRCMDIKKRAELHAMKFDSRRRAAVERLVAD